jgi:hypothetical protein
MTSKRFSINIIAAIVMIVFTGCASFDKAVYDEAFNRTLKSAQDNFKEKQYPQAVLLSRLILDAAPDNKEANAIINESLNEEPQLSSLIHKKTLGSNRTDRIANENFPLAGAIALYFPNRILDFLDLMTLELGGCFGAGFKFLATEYVSLGLQGSAGEGMVGLNRRHLSARGTVENFTDFFPIETRSFMEGRGYTGGAYAVQQHSAGMKHPEDDIFQRAKDFWAIGAQTEFIVYAVKAEFHPVEIYDLMAGFVFFDPLHDDIGVSKGFKFTAGEEEAMSQLAKQVSARRKTE